MATYTESTMTCAIGILEFIGQLHDRFSRQLIIKYSHQADFLTIKNRLDNSKRTEQSLTLAQNCIFEQGTDLTIKIYNESQWKKLFTLGRASEGDLLCQVSIKFDDLWKHLVSESQKTKKSNFKVDFNNAISGLQFWIVAEAHDCDLSALNVQVKNTMDKLDEFKSVLGRLGSASDGVEMSIEIAKTISTVNPIANTVFSCIGAAYKHLKNQEESHESMKSLTESIQTLAGQLHRLQRIKSSGELRQTIDQFSSIMSEVMNFIRDWLENWTRQYIFVAAEKDKAVELQNKVTNFKDRLIVELTIDIGAKQDAIADNVKSVLASVANIQGGLSVLSGVANLGETAKASIEQKELDDLVRALGGNRLSLLEPCMEGTRLDILQEIETRIKNTDGHNMIWIRGSPGVGKSALAASITIRLLAQKRHAIWFRFDRTQSTTITTEALWRVVACSLARQYPSLCQHLAQGNRELSSSSTDHLFEKLIQEPLSTLDGISCEELPVIVIDALDECGGLRHGPSGQKDYEVLLRTLRRWVDIDHLKKFKLVITSRPESRIARTFPESTSTYINIPSGSDVKPKDSASDDICTFLKSRLDTMEVEPAWTTKALDYLVPRAAGVFIWATTVAEFLRVNPEQRFHILQTRERERDASRFDNLYSLYSTVIETSFGHGLEEEEIKAVTSVLGATIFAKQPLDDTILVKLPGVEGLGTLQFIRNGLMSVIDSGPILRFHHRSFEDYLLSRSFYDSLPDLSSVQDQKLHERQLAAMCLNCMLSSDLHFNMCNLESSNIKNVDIPADVKSAISPLVSYSSTFWADHLVCTPYNETSMEAVKFVLYEKLLFWIEVMSILGKTHEVSAILKRALEWPGLAELDPKSEPVLFIRDAFRFILAFLIPISVSAPQIYLSALPFAPTHSLVAEEFRPRFPNTLMISDGRPSQWPMTVFVAEHHKDRVRCIALSPDEKTFASISAPHGLSTILLRRKPTMYVCDSETGHCISGPFKLRNLAFTGRVDAFFSPDGEHILVRCRRENELSCHASVWNIEKGEEMFQIEGFDFVFIHCGNNEGKIASIHWVDEDGSSIRTIASEDQRPTQILVKLWDIANGAFRRLFEINDIAVAQFSPNGKHLAVERQSESVVELWNLEDRKITRQFSHLPGNISSLHFSPTNDYLTAALKENNRQCLRRLDTQQMVSLNIGGNDIPPEVIHSSHTNRIFAPRDTTVEIWEVSATGSNMIFETEQLTDRLISSICPLRDGHRLLIGNDDGTVRMLSLEDLGSNEPVTQDKGEIIALSPSEKMVATGSRKNRHLELWDTTTWERVGPRDVEYASQVAFSADDNRIAVLSESLVTICDINHPENRLSFDPTPKGRSVRIRQAAFQTCNDLVICARIEDGGISGLLQIWKVKDHSECTFSLDINMDKYSDIFLAPDGLTVIIGKSCYSWNHNTVKFHPFHFADQAHLGGRPTAYSPDGKFFACESDGKIRVWDTRTGQLCGKPITMFTNTIVLSPALKGRSLGDQLIALYNMYARITIFDVHTGHLYAQFGNSGGPKAFIRDGTKLISRDPIRIYDMADLAAKHRNAPHEYASVPRDGWMVGQDDELLIWVPLEHRYGLCPSQVETMWGWATKVDFSNFKFGTEWTECIDQEWLKELDEREKRVVSCSGRSSKPTVAHP